MTCHDDYGSMSATGGSRRIVVGIDGSAASVAALRWADHQARLSGARLELVHVYTSASPYAFSAGGLPALYPCDPVRLEDSAHALLERTLAAAGVIAADAKLTIIDEPSITHALQRVAAGASMLVLGAHRHHGLGVLLGSTATSCVRHAVCPVVVVPATAPETVRAEEPVVAAAAVTS